MKVPSPAWLADRRVDLHNRWIAATPRTRVTIQMAVFIVVVIGAYNYTLVTLVQNVGLETPLAYVSLVPLIALFLAAVKYQPVRAEPPIHDRQLDYIVGLPLIAAAMAINLVLPKQLSVMYWVWRIDLLSMPLFVAGVVSIIFGVRVLWRQKLAVSFLLLAWPLPYSLVLLGVLSAFTNLTIDVLQHIVKVIHVATPIPGADNSLFSIVHHGVSFPLSVVSACSGVNSVVGFLLIGASFGAVVRGPIIRKSLWLAGGMLVIWAMNVLRLLFIFWTGKQFGEHLAISILHPFVGLVTFSIGVVLMILLIRPLGMTIGAPTRRVSSSPSNIDAQAPAKQRRPVHIAVPKVHAALVVVVVAGVILGLLNANLRIYNLVANSAGEPTLTSFNTGSAVGPPGFRRAYVTTYTWATPYFGDSSTWNRYEYVDSQRVGQSGDLYANEPVYEDIIDTTDLNSFSAYGIEACYEFHGYTLKDVSDVALGGGITGQTLAYQTQTNGAWSIVYWIVPVTVGNTTHYERIVLYLLNASASVVKAPAHVSGVQNLSGTLADLGPAGRVLVNNQSFLVTFARRLISEQAELKATSTSRSA